MEQELQFLLYDLPDDSAKVQVVVRERDGMADDGSDVHAVRKSQSTISEHISNIYAEGELVESETMRKFGSSECIVNITRPSACKAEV